VSAAPFAELAELAREEHRIVIERRYEALADLDLRRSDVLARLPVTTPPEALEHLREAARLQALITLALREAHGATHAELLRLGRTREGMRGYAAAVG
jgi:hypothetical protein